jgi:hypothetical protein
LRRPSNSRLQNRDRDSSRRFELRPAPALALLVLGSSVFLQAHLLLGYFVGEAARDLLEAAAGWALAGVALLALAGIVIWSSRRGGRVGGRGWVEGRVLHVSRPG